MNQDKLSQVGINYADGVKRFAGKEALYERFLGKFPQDPNYQGMMDALEQKDVKAAFVSAHTLKGVAGNLSIDKLYEDVKPVVEILRAGSLPTAEDVEPITRDYKAVMEVLTE